MNVTKNWITRAVTSRFHCRRYSQKKAEVKQKKSTKNDISSIRNIGILAHVDAGKTTTTERMLFYSGRIHQMGEVHLGNTVTDFMEQERQRGITIASAFVTFPWRDHKINLLDTPGHIDFTAEVENTLNVMDGAVVILDGSAGVEAQTITVAAQAERHNIPKIIYINKMDRPDAQFFRSVNSVREQLRATPIILHIPIFNDSKSFLGVVDLLTLRKIEWDATSFGAKYSEKVLQPDDGKLWENALSARIKLAESLADIDNTIAEMIISDEKKLDTISVIELRDSIRKITLKQKGIPILCGSSYKNMGVQPLMDAIIDYLPSPECNEVGKVMKFFGENLCARAFKVRHDKHKGPITFFRIYSGNLRKGQKIYNLKKRESEDCGKIYVAYADDYEEVSEVGKGNIAAVSGLKLSSTGDLITSSASVLSSAKNAFSSNKNSFKDFDENKIFTVGAFVPDPVFFCSVEPPSQAFEEAMLTALSELEREDPSLKVNFNHETGQTVLGGMGELHLDVIKERLRSEYKLDVETGPLLIAYKESLIENAKDTYAVRHKIGRRETGSGLHSVNITMSVLKAHPDDKEILLLDRSPECVQNISSIFPKHLLAVKNGVEKALTSGPKLYCPVTNVTVMLHWLDVGRGTSESLITSATIQCVKKLLKKGGTRLLEPIMLVEIVCNDKNIETIIDDLSRRRVEMISTNARGCDLVIRAYLPLSELLGYAKELRILTSGRANFSMEFHSFRDMNSEDEEKAIKSTMGF